MDDLTRKRTEGEAAAMCDSVRGLEPVIQQAMGVSTTALDAELAKVFGVPSLADVGVEHGMHWAGYVIGNMVGPGCSVADCHAVLAAVATLGFTDEYDVCANERAGDDLDKIPSGCSVEHRYSCNDVYRWARFFRVAVNEIAFGLEDHFDDPKAYPHAELLRRAVAGVGFLIDTMHPIYTRTL